MISLAFGGQTIELQEDLYWSDEHDWDPVEQTVVRSVTGALIITTAKRIEGRPITLQPIDPSSAWMTRKTVELLRHWTAVPGRKMVLTIHDETYNVIFRHQDGSVTKVEPVVFYNQASEEDGDFLLTTIRLMTVDE